MDYEVQRCTRHCAKSGHELIEGEEFFSVLVTEGADVRRYDYAIDAWAGPPDGVIGWWKSRMPTPHAKKNQLAPSEVLLDLFVEMEGVNERLDMRYVLALLLIRRRVLRLEETGQDADGELLTLYCPRDETTHRVRAATPSPTRTDQIQAALGQLLFAGAE